ncbi:hypothetical protein [Acinetobacter sp. 3657]|uniref:hypothetical protein n=1 Tax=Acinetobacter sp. 3657 TaxID=2817764 RepID=UPI0028571E4F|nr:hypothetical protein [Prolinoborus sp. 3657]
MQSIDLFESEIALIFDCLLHGFEIQLRRKVRLDTTEVQLRNYIRYSNWISEFIGASREWYWLLNLPDRDYCPRIALFAQCWSKHFDRQNVGHFEGFLYRNMPEILFDVAQGLLSPRYKRKKYDKAYQEKERIEQLKIKLNALVEKKSRLLPIRFELYYHREYVGDISSLEMSEHLHQFTKEMKNHRNFILSERDQNKQEMEILFYARVTEQGAREGHFHTHFLVILDGKYHRIDYRFRTAASLLWEKITTGRGYLSQHQPEKESYAARWNINGQIVERTDTGKLDLLFNSVAPYLAKIGVDSKYNQYLRIKPLGFDAFACSHQ